MKHRGYPHIIAEKDPDLGPGPLREAVERASLFLGGRSILTQEGWVEDVPKAPGYLLRLVVFCSPCRHRKTELASVHRTPEGMLFQAPIVQKHDFDKEEWGERMVMVHPNLPGRVVETNTSSFRVQAKSGWRAVPVELEPDKHFRPQPISLVRDLLDYDSPSHPPLRVKCRRGHGESNLDRGKLLTLATEAETEKNQLNIPLNAVRLD